MAFKAIMRGVGAAAESVGKGLAAIDVERKKQKQIEIQNKFQEDLIYLQEQEAAFQETKLETEEYLAGNQIEHERTQAQLDRVFEERLAIDQRTHEVATAALLVTTDRKGRELLEGLKQETMERKVLFEMLSDLSLLESGVYIENAENIFTILGASPGPDASAEDQFNKILQDNKIRISALGKGKLRIVTHLDYTEAMHQKFLSVLKNISL